MLKTEDVTATLAWFEVERDGVALQFLGGETPNGYFLTFTEPADGA